MLTRFQLLLILLSAVVAPRITSAQVSGVEGIIHRRGRDTVPVPDVEITLTPGDRVARADSLGRFRLASVRPGQYLLVARRIGMESLFRTIDVREGQQTTVRLAMIATAQELATITVNGRRLTYPARLTEAYTRMSRSTGTYFSREQIDSLFPLDVNSLLLRVPGIRLSSGGLEFARCRELPGADQHIQVYVDGVRLTRYGTQPFTANEVLRDIPPTSIQLMEIYSGVARLPGEYVDDACAVILVWRK